MVPKLSDDYLSLFCEKNSDHTKTLRLKGNELFRRIGYRLRASDMNKICDFLIKNRTIHNLNLSYNEIGDEGLKILCDKILSHLGNTIQCLNLAHCNITMEGMRHLYTSVDFIYLKKLRLYGNIIGPQGGYAAALLCNKLPFLEYLDLGETNQTVDSIDSLFYELHRLTVRVLNISRIIPYSASVYDSQFLAISLSEFFRINQYIVEIHVQKCRLNGHDIELMIQGLKQNTSLLFFDVGYNNLCDFGVELIANWLGTRPKLLCLNIAGNQMRNSSAVALSVNLPKSRIRLLDISANKISNYGMKSILNSIKKSTMLRYFYVWGNDFDSKINKIFDRLLRSGVLEQNNIDVKIYCVDGLYQAARYPSDLYKHRYYDVSDYGYEHTLKIKRNYIEMDGETPRALVKFEHVDRYPPLNGSKLDNRNVENL